LDFPGAISFGKTLDEAREMLAGALVDMAETNLLMGEPPPRPDPPRRTSNPTWRRRFASQSRPARRAVRVEYSR
jgi:hypothetical protein